MTAKDFVNKYIGTAHDVDGAYGVQCVDLFKFFTKVNYGISNYTTGNGWASGLWINRKSRPYYKYFVDGSLSTLQNGDWVIWGRGSKDCPDSHVAMFYNGKFFGQNQWGRRYATLANISLNGVIGVLRPKMYIPKPKPVTKTKYVNLPSNIDTWRYYSVNEAPVKQNANGFLRPRKYGGLSYVVRGYTDGNNCVIINTKNFGQVKIFIANTPASITPAPIYKVVG